MSQITRAMPAKLQGDNVRVLQIKIENFRGIKNADLTFGGHTLLVSGNNVGKSTVYDALDLVLGPDPKGRN